MNSSKRIVFNTGIMYGKVLVSIFISFFTSRLILDMLGVIDFGVYHVVGGVVTVFNFLNASMSSASLRFITFELGKKIDANIRKIFTACVMSHIGMALFIVLLVEIIGLFFFNKFINVPPERYKAAVFVYHFSAMSLFLRIVYIPYQAMIKAKERMHIIAIIDSIHLILKLLGVLYLTISNFDKLKVISVLIFALNLLNYLAYYIINRIKYPDSKLTKVSDKKTIIELFSFSFFSLITNLARVGRTQGVAILINIFFGPALNAAFSVSDQVSKQLRGFANNLLTAVNPQLIKRYAGNMYKEMVRLTYQASKSSFYILFLMASPFLFEMSYILDLWLKEVPQYSEIICRLLIINALIDVTIMPLVTIVRATGRIKVFQSVTGVLMLLNIPLSYLFLKLGFSYTTIFYIIILMTIIVFYTRLVFAKRLAKIEIKDYSKKVIIPILKVASINILIILGIKTLFAQNSLVMFLARAILGFLLSSITIYLIGITKKERGFINQKIRVVLKKTKLGSSLLSNYYIKAILK